MIEFYNKKYYRKKKIANYIFLHPLCFVVPAASSLRVAHKHTHTHTHTLTHTHSHTHIHTHTHTDTLTHTHTHTGVCAIIPDMALILTNCEG